MAFNTRERSGLSDKIVTHRPTMERSSTTTSSSRIPNATKQLALVQGIWRWLPVVPDKNEEAFPRSHPSPEDPITQNVSTQRGLPRALPSESSIVTPHKQPGRHRKPLSALKNNIVLPQALTASEYELAQFRLPKRLGDGLVSKRVRSPTGADFDGFIGLERKPIGETVFGVGSKCASRSKHVRMPTLTLRVPNHSYASDRTSHGTKRHVATSPQEGGKHHALCSVSVERSASCIPPQQVKVQVFATPISPVAQSCDVPKTPDRWPRPEGVLSITSVPPNTVPELHGREREAPKTPTRDRMSSCLELQKGLYASPNNIHFSMPPRLIADSLAEESCEAFSRSLGSRDPSAGTTAPRIPISLLSTHVETSDLVLSSSSVYRLPRAQYSYKSLSDDLKPSRSPSKSLLVTNQRIQEPLCPPEANPRAQRLSDIAFVNHPPRSSLSPSSDSWASQHPNKHMSTLEPIRAPTFQSSPSVRSVAESVPSLRNSVFAPVRRRRAANKLTRTRKPPSALGQLLLSFGEEKPRIKHPASTLDNVQKGEDDSGISRGVHKVIPSCSLPLRRARPSTASLVCPSFP